MSELVNKRLALYEGLAGRALQRDLDGFQQEAVALTRVPPVYEVPVVGLMGSEVKGAIGAFMHADGDCLVAAGLVRRALEAGAGDEEISAVVEQLDQRTERLGAAVFAVNQAVDDYIEGGAAPEDKEAGRELARRYRDRILSEP